MPGSTKKYPLAIVVEALDKATGPLRRIQNRIDRVTGPMKRLRGQFRIALRETGLPRIASALGDVGGALGSATRAAAGLVTKLTLISGGAAAAAFAVVKSFATAGDEVAKTSLRLGISAERLQAWRFAAERSGVAANTFDMAMQRAGRRVAEASAGFGEARAALRALGVSTRDVHGNIRSMEDLLPELADKLSRVEDAGARNAFAMKLFDSEGVALVQMFADGAKGLSKLEAEYEKLGGAIKGKSLKASESFLDVLTNLGAALSGVRNVIGEALLPVMSEMFGRLTDWISSNRERLAEFVQGFMQGLPARIAVLRSRLREFWDGLQPIIERLQQFASWLSKNDRWIAALAVSATGIAAVLAGPLVAAMAVAGKAVIALGVAFLTTPFGWITAGIAALVGSVVWLGGHWDWLGEKVDTSVGWIVDKLKVLRDYSIGVLEDIGGFFAELFGREPQVQFSAEAQAIGHSRNFVAPAPQEFSEPGEVVVRFENTPPGAKIESGRDRGRPVRTEVGHALPEVGL